MFVTLSEFIYMPGLEVEGVCVCQCVYVEESSGFFGICCGSAVEPPRPLPLLPCEE